jgi:hypothetical protein
MVLMSRTDQTKEVLTELHVSELYLNPTFYYRFRCQRLLYCTAGTSKYLKVLIPRPTPYQQQFADRKR